MTDDVQFSTERNVGRIRLNRPKAIHALTREMCDAMSEVLLAWRDDPSVQVVVIDHAEGRGFCAGGDVVMLARSGAGRGKPPKPRHRKGALSDAFSSPRRRSLIVDIVGRIGDGLDVLAGAADCVAGRKHQPARQDHDRYQLLHHDSPPEPGARHRAPEPVRKCAPGPLGSTAVPN